MLNKEMHNPPFRYCKKCLLRDQMDKKNQYESIQAYLGNLSPEDRVADALYNERLEICRGCDMLLEAMCRSCGCYVELRAAVEKNYCPRKRW